MDCPRSGKTSQGGEARPDNGGLSTYGARLCHYCGVRRQLGHRPVVVQSRRDLRAQMPRSCCANVALDHDPRSRDVATEIRRWVTGPLAAVVFSVGMLALSAPSAQADTVYKGCTIVSHPTHANHTNCPNADWSNSSLTGVNLKHANLPGLFMEDGNLRRAKLRGADLSGATLVGNDMRGADLSGADLSEAHLLWSNRLNRANLSGANLSGAELGGNDMRWADLSFTTLSAANVYGNDMRWAALAFANLGYADLAFVDLRGADFSYNDMRWADLAFANLNGAGWDKTTCPDGSDTGPYPGTPCTSQLSVPVPEL